MGNSPENPDSPQHPQGAAGAGNEPAQHSSGELIYRIASGCLALLLYATLADAAVETFLTHSPLRILVSGTIFLWLALNLALWRLAPNLWSRWTWLDQAASSVLVLLLILGVTAWIPGGQDTGVRLFGQSTSIVLAVASACAIVFGGVLLISSGRLPLAARIAGGLLAAYGAAAFLLAVHAQTRYSDLFHGASEWSRLPWWLQGAIIGGDVVVPCRAPA